MKNDLYLEQMLQYIAIDLDYSYFTDTGSVNYYVSFNSPEEFESFLETHVPKVRQDRWALCLLVGAPTTKEEA